MDVALSPERMKIKLFAIPLVLFGAFALAGHEVPKRPYLFVDGAIATAPANEPIRVHGYVHDLQNLPGDVHRFELHWNGACLDAELFGTLPDTMREQSEVVVDGHIERSGDRWVLVGSQLWAKCSTKYGDDPNNRIDTTFK